MESKFVFWAITSFIGLLFIIMGALMRTVWAGVFDDLHRWKTEIQKEGGTVTRDKFFSWCKENQAKCSGSINCRLGEIEDWRQDMFERGGPLTMQNHEIICEKVTAKIASFFITKLDDSLNHHRELVKKEFENITLRLEKSVMQATKAITESNGKK